ncbi:unnamed protein product [Echinostoma caproni]|uniref:WSC domain-containing protein n=1 Tax=Echinostoma caproni TaxID=27848 RepID=A0A183B8V0_9TREM|nr:unnamed protein product [Echinostoma caproni]
MSRSSLLVFFVVSVFVSEAFSEEWDSCYNACERHYQDDLQAPCKAGCRKAAELRQVSSGAEQPQSCAAMCARNYSEITQAGACEFGCDAPSDNIKTLLRFGNADKTSGFGMVNTAVGDGAVEGGVIGKTKNRVGNLGREIIDKYKEEGERKY